MEDEGGASTDPSRVPRAPARTQVRRREEQEPAGKPVGAPRPDDADLAGLERLSERFPGLPPELRELVEKKHPAVRKGDLPGAGRVAASDQTGGGHGVVGGTEGTLPHEAGPGAFPCGAVDLRSFKRLVFLEVGQDPRDHLNLIFPVYFELMRQFSCISPEGARDSFLH